MYINHNILHIIRIFVIENLYQDFEKLWILFHRRCLRNSANMNAKRKFNLRLFAICDKYKINSHYLLKIFASSYNYICYSNDIYYRNLSQSIPISDLRICPNCRQPINYYNIEKHLKKQH